VTVTPPTWFEEDLRDPEVTGRDHVLVRLAGGRYALLATDVAEVVPIPTLTRLPRSPEWVAGAVNWRGHVLPVVDLRPVLGLATPPLPSSARLVVITAGDLEVGVVTEAVLGLLEVPDPCPPAPAAVSAVAGPLVVGLVDDGAGPAVVLDTGALLGLRHRLVTRR
jgi:purine-binding chemotaxis protein CheW